ncbi:MAG: transposase [Nitrospira sp.]|jgi:putative transposase|nr:transposase [Nitrospira sp.]
MARQLRLEYPGALYHLTARGNEQQSIFHDDTDRQHFLTLLGREILQQRWRCYAYCLMGNHYHLLLDTPEPNLSRGMRRLNGSYTQRFNWRHQRVGHLLQGRFKSIVVERESYLLELCRYVVLNPVRAGMVSTPEEWAWSSYGATAGVSTAPPWLNVASVLELFEADQARARQAYRQFVADGIGRPSPWSEITGQIFLGSPSFRERMAERLPKQRPANVPRAQTDPTRLVPDEILIRVATVFGISPPAIIARTHREAYHTAVWLLRRAANEPLNTVAIRFGVSASRISKIQDAVESTPLTPQQLQVMTECKVKQ